MGDEGLLTSQDVARRPGVNRRTIARWVQEGRLNPGLHNAGRSAAWEDVRQQVGLRRGPGSGETLISRH